MRVTKKTIIEWMNKKFDELEMFNFRVYDVERTRFTSDQYEGGAAKLYIRVRDTNFPIDSYHNSTTLLCSYSMGELQDHLNHGFDLVLKCNWRHGTSSFSLSHLELELSKK